MNTRQKNSHSSDGRLPWTLLLLATGLILISFTCLGLVGGGVYYLAKTTGALQRWQALGTPPDKAVGFVTGDISVIFVSTAAGDIYGCKHEKTGDASCWHAAQEPLRVDPETQFDNPIPRSEFKPPRGAIADELVATIWYADAVFETRYVLLEDGTVWKWENERGLGGILACILGPIAGAILGIVTTIVLWGYMGLRRTLQRHNNTNIG